MDKIMRNMSKKLKIFMLHCDNKNTLNLPKLDDENTCLDKCQRCCKKYVMSNKQWYNNAQLALTDIIIHIIDFFQI